MIDSPAVLGQPFTQVDTEKFESPSNTSSVPPVGTVANTPLERSREAPVPVAISVEKGEASIARGLDDL